MKVSCLIKQIKKSFVSGLPFVLISSFFSSDGSASLAYPGLRIQIDKQNILIKSIDFPFGMKESKKYDLLSCYIHRSINIKVEDVITKNDEVLDKIIN